MSNLVAATTAEAGSGCKFDRASASTTAVQRIGTAAPQTTVTAPAAAACAGPPPPVVLRVARARILSVVVTAIAGATIGLIASTLFDHLVAEFAAPLLPPAPAEQPISRLGLDTGVPDAASALAASEATVEAMAPTF